MQLRDLLRGASFAAVLAAFSVAGASAAYATSQPVVLPTGATITPDAATGSVFQPLIVNLPDYPNRAVDGAQTTAISPDGKTLLILTSGFNKLRDANGKVQPQDSSEYVFVFDISNPSAPVQNQVLFVPRAFGGLVWGPDGTTFYVAGGPDDNLHTFAFSNGQWAEAGTPLSLRHAGNLMNQETLVGPTAAGVGITADGTTVIVADWETAEVLDADLAEPKFGGEAGQGVKRRRAVPGVLPDRAVRRRGRRVPLRSRGEGQQHGLRFQCARPRS